MRNSLWPKVVIKGRPGGRRRRRRSRRRERAVDSFGDGDKIRATDKRFTTKQQARGSSSKCSGRRSKWRGGNWTIKIYENCPAIGMAEKESCRPDARDQTCTVLGHYTCIMAPGAQEHMPPSTTQVPHRPTRDIPQRCRSIHIEPPPVACGEQPGGKDTL